MYLSFIVQVHFSGVTGNIEFDEYGFRKNYKFDVYNVGLNNGPIKVGNCLVMMHIGPICTNV